MRRGRRGRGRSGKRSPNHVSVHGMRPPRGIGGLTSALAVDIEDQVRVRGEGYYRQKRVVLTNVATERLTAEVKGKGALYHVTLEMALDDKRQRSTISALCDCPFFAGGKGYCKHIWATLCMADGTAECEFKAPSDHPIGFHTKFLQATPSRMRAVVSAEPDASGRIRAFSAASHAAPPVQKEPEQHKNRGHGDQLSWRETLKMIGHAQRDLVEPRQRAATKGAQNDVYYVIDAESTRRSGLLTLCLFRRTPQADGGSGDHKQNVQLSAAPVDVKALESFAEGADRDILTQIFGTASTTVARAGSWDEASSPLRTRVHSFIVAESLRPQLMGLMASTGRFGWLGVDDAKLETTLNISLDAFHALSWDMRDPWIFRLAVAVRKQDRTWIVRGEFRRGRITVPLLDIIAAFPDGTVIFKDRVIHIAMQDPRLCGWINTLKQVQSIKVPKADQAAFLRSFVEMANSPQLDLPSDSGWRIVVGDAKPKLIFLATPITDKAMVLMANYEFEYEAPPAPPPQPQRPHDQRRHGRRGPRHHQIEAPAGQAPTEETAIEQAPQEQNLPIEDNTEAAREAPAVPRPQAPQQLEPPAPPRIVLRRDRLKEEQLVKDLCDHTGVHPSAGRSVTGADVFVDASNLPTLVADLNAHGWAVEAEGKKLRAGRSFNVDVKSGVDWLDLRASFDFGGTTVELPRLLDALRRGDNRVQLGDGTVGLLPESWLKKLDPILRMGEDGQGDELRYRTSHAAFLDVLVSEAAEANLDQSFAAYRQKLAAFSGVTPREPAPSFIGELRPYQKQGLGWLEFLDEFGFGGCLADDMGLGKTVQVLAYLHKRRLAANERDESLQPSLIVAPTSLIYNWQDEAKRFTPDLKVMAHVGASRPKDARTLRKYDVIVTSYGTMRSDIELLQSVSFDYVILDEAQAIKNETTQSAKAARALKAQRRLAMSGTPVENRIAELGSIFRFLNPGMLDSAAVFGELFSGSGKLTGGKLETLARALRPFILRRTKEQVLPELPGKTESTVYCVLEPDQQREYDELAAHYRDSLKKKIKSAGLGKSRMHVLEALLRLRQLACHPGLIDSARVTDSSAKLDLLEDELQEVMDSGRKALVFSQFTSMLAIVKARLEAKGIVYEYLDGSTTDRKERVERFQNDPSVRVFLISLKAGGVGLNLTAADYCFILDPWWNPASEAQAIDRAHRIGQVNHVFAYRLIARGTVEEKILSLQAAKRQLVEGIIAEDGNVLADLSSKDLDFLFS
ncbi:MAG: hypothetical protein RL011_2330 [Pseudomonadota bacterium]